jgi:acetyl-CoA carboxylase carboxyl transferase subunit alpha
MAILDFEKPLVELEQRVERLKAHALTDHSLAVELEKLESKAQRLQRDLYQDLNVWQKVQLSRHPDRPYMLDYIHRLTEDFVELHGDRSYGDDGAIVAGFARFEGLSVAVIGHQKGRSTKEKLHRNFGMAHPEGYRKSCRVMELADRFRRPILTFIDTAGAYPGIGAEERGQSEAIGRSILVMSQLNVPIIATVLGEGGSGGALALGVANSVLMLEYSTYSVISPEGCASILWKDGARAPDAAEQLQLLAPDAFRLGICNRIVQEPIGGAHRDYDKAAELLRRALAEELQRHCNETPEQLRASRYAKFRILGAFDER